MEEVIKKILRDSDLSIELCDLLIGDFIRVYLDERTYFSRGVTYYTTDDKKQEGIRCALKIIQSSAPRFISGDDFTKIFRIADTMPTDVNKDSIVDLDNYDTESENDKFNNRLRATKEANAFTYKDLKTEVKSLNETKISTSMYDRRVKTYYSLKQKAEEEIERLELSSNPFVGRKLKQARANYDAYDEMYKRYKELQGQAMENNCGVDSLVVPRIERMRRIRANCVYILSGGKESLVNFYNKVIEEAQKSK